MRSAMPQFLTVNGFSASPPVPRGSQDVNFDPDANVAPELGIESNSHGVEPASHSASAGIARNRNDQGPCLYLGSQGQRCSRPALENGFCAHHTPAQLGAAVPDPGRKSRFAAIAVAALIIFDNLWPVISEVFREIIRLIHSH
jgi:hypothetical protein